MPARTFGCVRVVWNRTLAARDARYATEGAHTSYRETNAGLTAMKRLPELAWLNEVSSVPLQQTLRHQHTAFNAFFAGHARHPRFKSRTGRQSAHYTRRAFRLREGELWLAKATSPLRLVWSWPKVDLAALNPTMVVVSREPDGRWFVTFAVDQANPPRLPPAGAAVGIDLGLTDFTVLSTGERIPHPRHMECNEQRLKRYQRMLARKRKGSVNRRKARRKVARKHARIRDARRDFLHKTSTRLVREFDMMAVEDLNVTGMVRNRRLARSIGQTGWAEFRAMLAYKAERAGRRLLTIDRWYPSSKTCSRCGFLLAELSLKTRTWICPGCGARHDRDHNAAKNILAAGLAVAVAVVCESEACGDGVSHSGATSVQSSVKQESLAVRPGSPPEGWGGCQTWSGSGSGALTRSLGSTSGAKSACRSRVRPSSSTGSR
jgi:putative transposase